MTWRWLDCWWRAFGEGAEMRVLASRDRSKLAGGLALGLRGSHLWAMADGNTDLFRPMARSEADVAPLVEAVAAGPWSRITLQAMPIGEPGTAVLCDGLRERGWLVHETFREVSPIIDTSGSFEEYVKGLSSNARRQVGKSRRRLEREGTVELRTVEPVTELEPVLEESFALEAAGWKGKAQGAVLASERLTRFWRDTLRRYHDLGALRFSQLRLDGRLIAFCLGIVHGRRMFAMKTSYDEGYAYFSPGHILRLDMLERCFEAHDIDAHELLGPMLRWKERYATDTRSTANIRAYRRRPGPLVRYAGRRYVRPVLRPVVLGARERLNRLRGRRTAAAGSGA